MTRGSYLTRTQILVILISLVLTEIASAQLASRTKVLLVGGEYLGRDSKGNLVPGPLTKALNHVRVSMEKSCTGSCEILGSGFQNSTGDRNSIAKMEGDIQVLENLIRSGSNENVDGRLPLRANDQVLIQISSHGQPPNPGECGHEVEIGNSIYHTRDLKDLRDKLTAANVKVAIMDLSCYSGASSCLADENTCVISAANSGSPAFLNDTSSLGARFWESVAILPGNTLEEHYLRARTAWLTNSSEADVPTISTDAHEVAHRNAQTFFAKHFPASMDDGLKQQVCDSKVQFIQNLRALLDIVKNSGIERIPELIASYRNLAGQWQSLLSPHRNHMYKLESACRKGLPKKGLGEIDFSEHGNEEKCVQKDLIDDLKVAHAQEREAWEINRELQKVASQILNKEREIYDSYYRDAQKLGENPCQKFRL